MKFIAYIPILTTVLSFVFLVRIGRHYLSKPGAMYLMWWTIGVLTFGAGTLTESLHAINGWTETNTRVWYAAGALLGGFPLAQGTVYLLASRRLAHATSLFFTALILVASVAVFLSPVYPVDPATQPLTGKVFTWHWVRWFSPVINLYSLVFLVGGAIYSARMYRKMGKSHTRYLGNILIAAGGLLPGIGGTFTRFGYVEVLFITELLGLFLIYRAYLLMRQDSTLSVHAEQLRTTAQ